MILNTVLSTLLVLGVVALAVLLLELLLVWATLRGVRDAQLWDELCAVMRDVVHRPALWVGSHIWRRPR